MSTRCQVIIKDEYAQLWFYRHCDGYPEGTLPTLKKFLSWVIDRRIRDNVEQSAGWLVMLGAQEYSVGDEPGHDIAISGWKVGAYEPCTPVRHDDIEYLYTIDLQAKTLSYVKTPSIDTTKDGKVVWVEAKPAKRRTKGESK